ncbi:hypothetical protein PMZ80_000421 [Knufia obscura]|uniref:Bud22 domain-containing protein n=1 Tax=Knufia obscura TaxID=1635080 RepID=A0ABR0S1A2_9EURO|nr:hypothetical protein PMZ80_000421 [Knufia obscura]
MSKRKREEEFENEIARIENQAIRIKVSRLKARFENGVSQLTAQLKLARGFDRQKMSRRIKQAGSDKGKLERLEAEVQVLRGFNERKVARNYLLKQCVRTKRIAEAEAFKSLFAGYKIKPSGSVAEGNVLGRLFKSNPVSEVLPGIMKGIREVVGADKPAGATVGEDAGIESSDAKRVKFEPVRAAEKQSEDEFAGFSDADEGDVLDIPEEELMDLYNARLTALSDDEDESENELGVDGQDHDRDQDSMEITTDEDDGVEDEEVSISSESEDESDTLQSKSNSIKPTPSSTANTSFLPSLMHGGYYSGSEPDEDDARDGYDPDKAYAAAAAKPRKNRRGQRARQAIAEKKHGTKAAHLLKATGAQGVHGDRQRFIAGGYTGSKGKTRNDGWDARRGAVESSNAKGAKIGRAAKLPNRSERRNGIVKDRAGSGRSTGANSDPVVGRARPTKKEAGGKSEKMHPSWEAARKRKMETANAGAGSFTGKKITFD